MVALAGEALPEIEFLVGLGGTPDQGLMRCGDRDGLWFTPGIADLAEKRELAGCRTLIVA